MTEFDKYHIESNRLKFLTERDGIEGAVDFAKRTMTNYRRAVVSRKISREKRRTFIASYLAFKQFLRDRLC